MNVTVCVAVENTCYINQDFIITTLQRRTLLCMIKPKDSSFLIFVKSKLEKKDKSYSV